MAENLVIESVAMDWVVLLNLVGDSYIGDSAFPSLNNIVGLANVEGQSSVITDMVSSFIHSSISEFNVAHPCTNFCKT